MKTIDMARESLASQGESLIGMSRQLGPQFEKAYRLVSGCGGTILVCAFGKSGAVGAKIAATLRSAGKRSIVLNPVDALHGEMASVQTGDVAIIVSSTGESDELMRIVPWLKKNKVKIISLTPSERSSLARVSDILLKTSLPSGAADSCASYSSCVSALAIGDLLGLCLLFDQNIERTRRPDDDSPEAIYTIEDIINTRPLNPTVPTDMIFRDALLEMTAKGLGAISIVGQDGKLAGILTDGDIRRLLQKSQGSLARVFLTNVESVMTRNPKNITVSKTVFDALKLMESLAITVLPVIDSDGRPVGMVHLHDLVLMGMLHRKPEPTKKKGAAARARKK